MELKIWRRVFQVLMFRIPTALFIVVSYNDFTPANGVTLQHDMSNARHTTQISSPAGRAAWFHPPKCGTSFGATVLHYVNATLPEEEGADLLERWGPFFDKYPYEQWFKDSFWLPKYDHMKVDSSTYEKYRNDWVGLFRVPEQRTISSYFDKARGKGGLLGYAMWSSGTVVRELSGQEDGEMRACWPNPISSPACGRRSARNWDTPPTPDLDLALQRLADFKFVGLIEQFDLSVCLFHAMFGGKCLAVEFSNMRRTDTSDRLGNTIFHDEAELKGYKDPFDGQLYEIAAARFWRDAGAHGVNRSFCKELCADAALVFEPVPTGTVSMTKRSGLTPELGDEYDWPGRFIYDVI